MIPDRLRAVADRLDEIERQRIAVLLELGTDLLRHGYAEVIEPPASLPAGGNGAAEDSSPVEAAAPDAPLKVPMTETFLCPRCDRPFGSKHAVDIHAGKAHRTRDVRLPSDGARRPPAPRINGARQSAPTHGLIPGMGE